MSFKINDEEITKKLEQTREQVGGVKEKFTLPERRGRINEAISGKDVENLFHPSGFLVEDGNPVFVYIRDHYFVKYRSNVLHNPQNHNKVHFAVCDTLLDMKKRGRYESRYHKTDSTVNLYDVDYAKETKKVRLHPCEHCLKILDPEYFQDAYSKDDKIRIKGNFDPKETLDIIFNKINPEGLRGADVPTGYPPNMKQIADAYKKSMNYTCEVCGVNLSENKELRELVDLHHKDGDKTNNKKDNFLCLCKLCHVKEHPFYGAVVKHKKPDYESIIKAARKRQRINV